MNQQQLLDAVTRRDFSTFVQLGFPLIYGGQPLEWNWHIAAMIHALNEVASGQRRRQIINMPPRMLKSLIVSVMWPAFLLGNDPSLEIIVSSYGQTLAERLSLRTRQLMLTDWYQRVFPNAQFASAQKEHLMMTGGGGRQATSIHGSITGHGADIIIIDDPLNAIDAHSDTTRQQATAFIRQSLLSRGNRPAHTKIVTVMQRLHPDDLAGHFLEVGGWDLLKLQACASEDADIPIGGGVVHPVRVGDLLFPTWLAQADLDEKQRELGSKAFQAQYQQDPAPAGGLIIDRAWFRYRAAPPREGGRVTISLDTAVKTGAANDFSVATVWLEKDGVHHLLHVWREKVDFPTLLKRVLALAALHRPEALLIEDTASGSALIQTLRHQGWPVIGRSCRDPKISRLESVTPMFEAGRVWFPKDAPWLATYETELLSFPGARHDDQVDSTTLYLLWRLENLTSGRFEIYWT
jgi:predicted phage terminase large subunit-like protein